MAQNILLIMSDQHHKSVMGCAGDQVVRTPNIDRMAAQGVRFSNCYAAAPVCVPSRMSFLTSRLPSNSGVWSETALASETPTLAHVMALAGYETSLIGRMHFIGGDQRHGFLQRPIGEFTARFPGTRPKGGKPWQHYPGATAGQFRAGLDAAGHGSTFYQYLDEAVTEATCSFLEEKGKARDQGNQKPFFAVSGMVLPHSPYIAPRDLFEYYFDRVTLPEEPEAESLPEAVHDFRNARELVDTPVSRFRARVVRAAYYALVEAMDLNIGRILSALEASGLAEDTLVIYCSDHGDLIGEHGCWWKSIYYEGSVGVPLVMSGSPVAGTGQVSHQLCSLLDIGPTFFDLAGAKHVHRHDGISLLPIIRNESEYVEKDRELLSEMVDIRRDQPAVASRMLRHGKWKLWQHFDDRGFSPPVLFDLESDPGENADLSGDPRYAAIRKRMMERMYRTWRPEADRTAAMQARQDLIDVIQRFGREVEPTCPDTLPFPDDRLEADVHLIADGDSAYLARAKAADQRQGRH